MISAIKWYFYKFKKILWSLIRHVELSINNKYSKKQITSDTNITVSLTSYGKRIKSVHLAIESIGLGKTKPKQIILWIDDEDSFKNLPAPIKRLVARGLTIKLTKNLGPHTKYYPYIAEANTKTTPLVTADDDMLYPKNWLSVLWTAYQKEPTTIHCMRARVMEIQNEKLKPFKTWRFLDNAQTSPHIFLEGVSGVIYPTNMLRALEKSATDFLATCPKHDDVWLNVIALRNHIPIKQVHLKATHYPEILGTAKLGLMNENIGSAGDAQISASYTPTDMEMLKRRNNPASSNEHRIPQ